MPRWLRLAAFALLAFASAASASSQARGAPQKKPGPSKSAPVVQPVRVRPEMKCPAVLGTGITSKREFCDVVVGRDPQAGIVIHFPLHRGPAILTFDLHNREMYSEQLVREKRAYTRHTATIGVLTLDGVLITRAVIDNEFRTAKDLLDRVSGGAGPGGMKAVAPIGDEPIRVEVPEEVDAVSVLGEKLLSVTVDGLQQTFTAPGRPIAVISNVMIEYRPAPPTKKKTPVKKK